VGDPGFLTPQDVKAKPVVRAVTSSCKATARATIVSSYQLHLHCLTHSLWFIVYTAGRMIMLTLNSDCMLLVYLNPAPASCTSLTYVISLRPEGGLLCQIVDLSCARSLPTAVDTQTRDPGSLSAYCYFCVTPWLSPGARAHGLSSRHLLYLPVV
jgi:hypothetical protein